MKIVSPNSILVEGAHCEANTVHECSDATGKSLIADRLARAATLEEIRAAGNAPVVEAPTAIETAVAAPAAETAVAPSARKKPKLRA